MRQSHVASLVLTLFAPPNVIPTPLVASAFPSHISHPSFLCGERYRSPSPFRPPLTATLLSARYGPPELESDFWDDQEKWEKDEEIRGERRKLEFQRLLNDVMAAANPDHLPGIMTRNVDLLLSMRGYEGVALMREAMEEALVSGDDDRSRQVEAAVDYILTFVEEFVGNARQIDENNKALLGKIVRAITNGWDGHGDRPGRTDEALLDDLMDKEKEKFTPGFLRYLEGECGRIASAPKMTPESGRLLQTMRILQTRVLEELGAEMGEGAQVLGQLLGYENRAERLAVLDAGLTVRGVEFAEELATLTAEALGDFPKVPGGADLGLVRIVEEIDERIRKFIESSRSFQ